MPVGSLGGSAVFVCFVAEGVAHHWGEFADCHTEFEESAPGSGEIRTQAVVTATFAHATQRLLVIVLADGSMLPTTAGHRLYSEEAGWTLASALRVGDRLRGSDGASQAVTAVTDQAGLAPEMVYDLKVDGPHTFFVRTDGGRERDLLVHNCLFLLGQNGVRWESHQLVRSPRPRETDPTECSPTSPLPRKHSRRHWLTKGVTEYRMARWHACLSSDSQRR